MLGAGGQLLLFHAVRIGPPYLIFPIISLSPALTIALSFGLLGERTGKLGLLGIALALLSLPLFDYRADGEATGYGLWFLLALGDPGCVGRAGVFHQARQRDHGCRQHLLLHDAERAAVHSRRAGDDGFLAAHQLRRLDGWGLAAVIQLLNAVGALTLVFAFRYGKAIIVSPMVNAGAPLLTACISLGLAGLMPGPLKLAGIALALGAALLLALQPEEENGGQKA